VCCSLPVRVVIFAVIWLLTWGKLSFWLLPNLTEDVGFFDSFRPVYQCTFASKSEGADEDKTSSGGDADKGEDAGEKEEKSEDRVEELEAADDNEDGEEDDENNVAEDDNDDDDVDGSSDDEVDKDEEHLVGGSDNGYEMVSAEDVENGAPDDEAAENGEGRDGEESRPSVRRRKGKRRIT